MPADGDEPVPAETPALSVTPEAELPESWTLLLPAISIANEAQLAIDLILSTMPAEHLGHLPTPDLLPFAAPSPKVPVHKTSLVTALEVYRLLETSNEIIVLQQRSPSANGRTPYHARAILQWAFANGCTQILLLSGANAAGLRGRPTAQSIQDQHLSVWNAFRVALSTKGLEQHGKRSKHSLATRLRVAENIENDPRGWPNACADNVQLDGVMASDSIPRFLASSRPGSFVRTVLEVCEKENIALTTLFHFVHEGDNAGDAVIMASVASLLLDIAPGPEGDSGSDVLEQFSSCWKLPSSWIDTRRIPLGLF